MAWYGDDWTYRKKITINSSKVGGSLSNFPFLFNTTNNDFKTTANGGKLTEDGSGIDIIFTDSDGVTQLKHEIEDYDDATGQIVAWVKVPSLGDVADKILYIYYGNSGGTNEGDPTNVWDSDYVGVYHLDTSLEDSTSNNNDGTNQGTVDATGKIARGRDFEFDDTDYINIGNDSDFNGDTVNNEITVEAWINSEGFGGDIFRNTIVGREAAASGWTLRAGNTTNGNLDFFYYTSSGQENVATSNQPLVPGTWYHVVADIDGSNKRLFINGQSVASNALAGNFVGNSINVNTTSFL